MTINILHTNLVFHIIQLLDFSLQLRERILDVHFELAKILVGSVTRLFVTVQLLVSRLRLSISI